MQRAIWLTLIVGLAAQVVYSQLLPEHVANHFGSGGVANGWMSNTANLLVGCAILLFNSAIFLAIPRILGNTPQRWISFPNKAYWLAPERRQQSLQLMSNWVGFSGLLTNMFMLVVFHLVFQANRLLPPHLDEAIFLLLLISYFVLIGIWLVLLFSRFKVPKDICHQ